MNAPPKPRIDGEIRELTVASTIGILLIVFGHSFVSQDYGRSNPAWYRAAKHLVYGFHIHLFSFLSGFLLAHVYRERSLPYGRFLQGRFLRLLFPYFVYSLINCLPNALIPGLAQY